MDQQLIQDLRGALNSYAVRLDHQHTDPLEHALLDQLCRAIAFQRQVLLGYSDTVRMIEPHLIRETSSGRLLLYATKIDPSRAPECRSYRIDRIESVEVTQEPFTAPERPHPTVTPVLIRKPKPRNQCGRKR